MTRKPSFEIPKLKEVLRRLPFSSQSHLFLEQYHNMELTGSYTDPPEHTTCI